MIKGKTKSGFEFTLKKETLDDMELLEALAEVDGGNIAALPKVTTRLLGNEQKKALYDHLRTEAGNVPVEAFTAEIAEIVEAAGEAGKNS